jgi:hypothetical protein
MEEGPTFMFNDDILNIVWSPRCEHSNSPWGLGMRLEILRKVADVCVSLAPGLLVEQSNWSFRRWK